jgi:hypothetical protein
LFAALGLGLVSAGTGVGEDETSSVSYPSFLEWQELAKQGHIFEHWTPEENSEWSWYRAERYFDGDWKSHGISLPVNRKTGEMHHPADDYVALEDIPPYVLTGDLPQLPEDIKRQMAPSQYDPAEALIRLPDAEVQMRDGRPPSEWLRSLFADELRTWLKTIDITEATVDGMTFWVHLVRDHSFDPRRIEGLTEHEFLLLHSAAHFGY